jgi:hypothetical protein
MLFNFVQLSAQWEVTGHEPISLNYFFVNLLQKLREDLVTCQKFLCAQCDFALTVAYSLNSSEVNTDQTNLQCPGFR